jgi:hypothetical protein
MKEENGEHVGTSFFLLPLQCTIVYSTHNATSNLLLTRQKRASILPAEQREIEFMCLRDKYSRKLVSLNILHTEV